MAKGKKNNKIIVYYISLALFSFLIYSNTMENGFVFDDESVVQNNSSITNLANIPKFFTAEEGFHKVIGRYFRPVVSTTYTIDFAIWGLNPAGFHFTNILINLICCLLLFPVLKNLFAKNKFGTEAAFIGTFIFASHAIHTEAVSWISGRTDSLATLFFFAAFLYFIKFDNMEIKMGINGKFLPHKYIIISLLFYMLGLLSKEMVVTFPAVLFLYDFLFKKRKFPWIMKNRLAVYVWFISLTFLYLFIRYLVLKNVPERESYMYFYDKDFITLISTMIKTLPVYFKLLIAPVNLLYHYNGVMPYSYSFLEINVVLSVIFLLFLLFLAYFFYKKDNVISFAILFFLVSLVPVMNIIPSMNYMAERFLYVTSFSLSVLVSYLIIKFQKYRNIAVIISIILISIYSVLTYLRNTDWKDNDTLYSTAEGINGSVLLVNCGNIYANKKQFDEAALRYKKALEINKNSVLANHNLGLVFLIKGNIDSAEFYFKRGIEVDSLAPDGYFQLAGLEQNKGNITGAINYLEKLQLIVPDYRGSKTMLDNLKSLNKKNIDVPGNPGNQFSILEQRSFKYYQEGKYELALKDLEELVKINPEGRGGYYNNIALCFTALGKYNEAEISYLKAIDLDEKNVGFLTGLSDLYLKAGKNNKAREYYQKILIIEPGNQYALSKLDSLKK